MIPFSFQLRKLKERQITLLDNCYLQKKVGLQIEMHISRREIEKREIGDREISREKWGIEKSGKNREKSTFFYLKDKLFFLRFHVKKAKINIY